MSRLHAATLVFLTALTTVAASTQAGLYDDDTKNVTGGDLADQDYWWTKFDMMMLDLAIKQRQPEGKIGFNLVSTVNRLNDLIKKYPKDAELVQWKARAEEIQKKVDPNAPRGTSLNAGCPWDEANFSQLWVNWHFAKMLLDAKDYGQAYTMLTNVMQNYEFMLRPDRMKDYPDDLRKWVVDSKDEANKMMALAKSKTNR